MDVHVKRAITLGLRRCGVDVVTAQEDGTTRLSDSALLDRAASLGRVLFSQDTDLLAEAAARQRSGTPFAGVIYVHQCRLGVGQCVRELELLACAADPQELVNRVQYLPLA
jgi:predicted nuclease of predicted toxin-antitoxin system